MYYKVLPGESFHHICQRFKVNPEELMVANKMTEPFVTPGQMLIIPFHFDRASINSETGNETPWKELNENDDWRQVPSPQETKPLPDTWPIESKFRKGNLFTVFTDKDIKKNIPIYISRGAFVFMSKMAMDDPGCYSICDHSVKPCGQCFKRETHPFYVMPYNTNMVSLGDYGVVINTRTKKAAYALCADWGKPHDSISFSEGTRFIGRIGEGSVHLGRQLDIKDIHLPNKAFEPNGVLYIVFPNSADGVRTIKSVAEINKDANKEFKRWGGWEQAEFLLKEHYNITL
jgi:hypothetical protein